ncbi:MAG: hypothetical protein K2M39_03345 [Muribaculaceae bacterium]|nr:hypothetical protein [Muribaculaceae bacterium]
MKHSIFILIILSLSMFATSCHTNKTASVSMDSVNDTLHIEELHDMAVQSILEDSVTLERVVFVKDSVILTTDTSGNVIKSERFHTIDTSSNRERLRNHRESKERKDSVTGKSSSVKVNKKDIILEPQEKRLGWWDRTLDAAGDVIATSIILLGMILFLWLVKRTQ